ncbi:MAG: hypothetical protein NXI35_09855 [bacterium]|nr:hypothetical protein [bacterium]
MHASSRTSLAFLLLLVPWSGCTDDVTGQGPSDDEGSTSTGGTSPDPSDPSDPSDPTVDPSTTSDGSTTADPTVDPDSSGTTDGPACDGNDDCADMATECTDAVCEGGRCVLSDFAEGTPCGDATDAECNGADACDGAGTCVDNVLGDGAACLDCDGLECACSAGACSACAAFAETNEFTTTRSTVGWELTGDWGLYTGAPSAYSGGKGKFGGGGLLLPQLPFGGQVFGTDGNRSSPYPGGHEENSYARTKPFLLPATLDFLSWHLDEGSGTYDNKFVRVSVDGGKTWTDLLNCGTVTPDSPLCASVSDREPDDWTPVSLDVPKAMVGQVGIVEFAYATGDGCCDFERGWFIDTTSFATECACGADSVCDAFATECGGGACGAGGACDLEPVGAGAACGSNASTSCGSADSCDDAGYCQANDLVNLLPCEDCPAGEESCNGCLDGVCSDCPSPNDTFEAGLPGWNSTTTEGGSWTLFSQMPGNEDGDPAIMPMDTAFLGNDGSTLGGAGSERVLASITSPVDTMPDMLIFDSWHVDEGGAQDQPAPTADTKRVEVSIDLGMTWFALADCNDPDLDDFPFCVQVETRGADEWDTIMIDTAEYAGMDAQIRFTYDTGDNCCGFEYGWYIDDLNFAQTCPDPNPASGDGGGKD